MQNCALQQTTPLHLRPCGERRWLACHPSGNGRIVVMDSEVLALLEQFSVPATIHDVMQQAATSWSPIAVEEVTSLLCQLGLLQDASQMVTSPVQAREEVLSAWLHVTNACTLRCPYCYLHKTDEHMADDIARRSVDAIFRSAIRGHFQHILLKYAGGEASLQMPHVLAIHDYASQLAQQHNITLRAYIMSNGVVLPQRSVEQLKERRIGVMISLDGIGDYHDSQRPFISGKGSFKYVDRTISQLLNSGLMPHINVTVSQRNLDGLPALTRYILERDLSFTFSYYRDNDCSTHMHDLQFADGQMIDGMLRAFAVIEQRLPRRRLIDSLIDKASMRGTHQHTCGVGRTYMVIDQRGQVAKCHADIKQAVTTIDADDPLQIIRNDRSGVQAIPVEEKQGCRSCEWRHWCTGGCPLLTYRMTGRNDIRSPNCNIYKALFPEALRLEALRLLKYEAPMIWS
ncbi:MAG: radical SAM protein [Ktedonobacteraceae bacterium]|nr:radical SAM protein [Ktedonobacteraceae bacterium]